MKKFAFTFLCCNLLMLFAAPSWAQGDQCSSAGPVGSDISGSCSVVITVTAVDPDTFTATAFTVTSTGTPAYDTVEDVLVGVQNSSGSTLKFLHLSSPTESIFGFDGDGPCSPTEHPGSYLWCPPGYPTSINDPNPIGYEGPNNTFSVTNSMSGTVNFTGDGIPPGETTWFALEGTPQALVGQTLTTPVLTTTPSDLLFNQTAGNLVEHIIDWTGATGGVSDPELESTNKLLSNTSDWPQYVVGTPFAPSHCFVRPGNGGGGDLCSMYIDQCFNTTTPPSDANCPTEQGNGVITIKDKFDQTTEPAINPNTTAALIEYFPNKTTSWSPSTGTSNPVCTDATGAPTFCDIFNLQNFNLSGDQTTSSGGTKRKGTFITVHDVPMLETQVTVNGVAVNSPGVQGSTTVSVPFQPAGSTVFDVNPAGCPFPVNSSCPPPSNLANNFFVPAPPASLSYQVTGPTPTSGTPTFSTSTVAAQKVTDTTVLSPGSYVVTWLAKDNVGLIEQNIHQVPPTGGFCPGSPPSPAPSTSLCYVTSPFTANVIVTPPPSADLALIKFGNLFVKTQTNITYTIGLVNLGPNTAYGVTITDTLPGGTDPSSATAVFSTVSCTTNPLNCSTPIKGASCSRNGNTITCSIGTLPPWTKGNPYGAGVKLVVKATAAAGGKITNTASATAFNSDPNPGSNSFSWTTFVTK